MFVSPQVHKSLDRDTRFVEDVPEGSGTDALMIGHDYPAVGIGTPKNYVPSFLPAHNETNPLQDLHQLLSGDIRGQLH